MKIEPIIPRDFRRKWRGIWENDENRANNSKRFLEEMARNKESDENRVKKSENFFEEMARNKESDENRVKKSENFFEEMVRNKGK